ncbi:hypothetical protein JCM6882_001899 [Rhodosporidiobolus microsporus]
MAVPEVLHAYSAALNRRPLRTKQATSAVLCFLSQVAADLATRPTGRSPASSAPSFSVIGTFTAALKLACYGCFIGAPLDHYLYSTLQKVIGERSGKRWKTLVLLVSNGILLPVANTAYLSYLSIMNGARSFAEVRQALKKDFLPVWKLTAAISTACLLFAQRYLAPVAWTPFLAFIGSIVGTIINIQARTKGLGAAN